MKKFIIALGVCWAIAAWSLWLWLPHHSYKTALAGAIYLAPSYLLLSAFRGAAIPMRIFVATALPILILVGLRIVPGNTYMRAAYIIFPPTIALVVALYRAARLKSDKSPP